MTAASPNIGQASAPPLLFGAICPAQGTAAGLVLKIDPVRRSGPWQLGN
jgi:hypothetical protein